ncbi:NAD(P)-binding protein [Annulohypoxylon maeteangense]|uniref:NAD(P)-binding protein n=1 Tax=Annulohypoxylon maeteangense TaxID=1927788 RepID=UPI0020081042|nr:NAD(P)-binding protein [Annulohypoxylon maeteangense]KAI0882371.1 NAD(P)-binding protein [Annulohypoxylon maeteangense]
MTEPTIPIAHPHKKTVFVTGANGYIGSAVCRTFVRAGWRTYGLVRRPEAASTLISDEVIPIIGSISKDAGFLEDLHKHTKTVDVVISCTEQLPFGEHFEALLSLFRKLAATSNQNGVRPLVITTSGCKDYGVTGVHGSPGLAPHTEDSPLQPVDIIRERALKSLDIFVHEDLFDAVLVRPTPLFGYDSSYYGLAFEAAEAAARTENRALQLPIDFNTILHGCHIDDCAEAYLALAEHADRAAVVKQCFNISAHRYDTLSNIAKALEVEYSLKGGVVEISPAHANAVVSSLNLVLGYTQFVDSTKIRRLTGWTDRRMLLSENLHVYRMAYEEAARRGHEGVLRIKERMSVLSSVKV